MKKIFLAITLCLSLSAYSQQQPLDIQFGLGAAFFGSGDIITGTIEGEINYKLNNFFTSNFGANSAFGYRSYEYQETTTYAQANVNILVSPFGNDKPVDFKFGTGLSFNNVWERRIWSSSTVQPFDYRDIYRNSLGVNMIVETTFKLKNDFLFGIKGFIQPYYNSDINSGILFKVGKVI